MKRRPLSNFDFVFKRKIISSVPSSTGYLVEVTPEVLNRDSEHAEAADSEETYVGTDSDQTVHAVSL